MVTTIQQQQTIPQFTTSNGGSIKEFLQTTYVVFKRQNFRLLAMKSQVVAMIAMPLMWLLIMAPSFNNLIPSGANGIGGVDYVSFITAGILIQVTMFSSLFGSINLFFDRDSGYLKNYLIAPISRFAIFFGYTLGLFTRISIQVAVILILSYLMGSELHLTPIHLLAILAIILLVTIFIFGFSVTVAAKAENVEAFQAILMPITMPLMFLSPIMYPLDALPKVLRYFARLNPITYGVESVRGTLFGNSFISAPLFDIAIIRNNVLLFNVLVLFILAFGFLYLGSKAFIRSLNK